MTDLIEKANKIVIKIGSSLMVNQDEGTLNEEWLKALASDIASLRAKGKNIIIVTSGAVALGRKYITSARPTLKLEEKQAAAACGQPELARHYQKLLREYNISIGQVLLTMLDSETRRNYLNAKNTLETLLSNGIIPIINENDTVTTEELRFGDNDRLAARVAQMVSADLLILLSDVDGLYTGNPRLDPAAKHIPEVHEITRHIEDMASGPLSGGVGSGGMITKIDAAKISVSGGCTMILASGIKKHPIQNLENNGKHTVFFSRDNPDNARKRWIASSLNVLGEIIIDDGAVKALKRGKSLLPAGVIDVTGDFERGDTVIIKDGKLNKVGVGISAYASGDARLIMGQQSDEIENMVGFVGRNELIHTDNLVLSEI